MLGAQDFTIPSVQSAVKEQPGKQGVQQDSARMWVAVAVMYKIWREERAGVLEACGVEVSGNGGVIGSGML